MKLLAVLKDTKSRKYGIYYCIVLAGISLALLLEGLGLFHLSDMQHMSTYFEGLFSLVMFSRNDMGKSFLRHLNCTGLFQGRQVKTALFS